MTIQKKYNHAFTISFSIDTDLNAAEFDRHMQTCKGLSELTGHLIKRAQCVLEQKETEAYDLWDSYEN